MIAPEVEDRLVAAAAELVVMVRDESPEVVGRWVRRVLAEDWPGVDPVLGLLVTLAAMVPDDRPLADLLAWVAPDHVRSRVLRAAHAARERLRAAGRPVPAEILDLDRQYHAERPGRRRVGAA